MTSAAALVALTAVVAKASRLLPTGHTAAGDPLHRCRRVINGHLVQVEVIGWGGERIDVTLPYEFGTEVLSIDDVAELIAD